MKRKFKFILIIFVLILSLFTINTNAVDLSFTTTLTPSNTTVSEATEVIITVSVANLNVGDSGINAFSAYLSYDSDVFETLTDSSVEGLNSWVSTYTASSGQIFLTKNSFVNSDEQIMQITLKTKEGVAEGTEGIVSLTGIVVQNSEEDISGENVSTTITVGTETSSNDDSSDDENGNENDAPIVINPITNNENNTDDDNNNNNDDDESEANTSNTENNSSYDITNINTNTNESEDDIPYAGPTEDAFIKIILGFILIALAIYIKIRKMDDIK